MKSILFLCITVIVFLLMAGCSQTAQQGQPAATATPTTPAGTVSATPVSATPVVTMTTSVSGNTVIIQNMVFNPAQITVNAGSIVRWVNKDKVAHSVVFSPEAKIDTFVLSSGQAFTVKLDNPGVYNYSCGLYPEMQGSVVVT